MDLTDNNCVVWSANLKQAPQRLENLYSFIRSRSKRPPDVVLVQDPPPNFAFKSCAPYSHWYQVAEGAPLTEDDYPYRRFYRAPYTPRPQTTDVIPRNLAKAAFLIHRSLSNIRIAEAKGANRGLVATLYLATSHGTYAFHNIYNHEDRADLTSVMDGCMSRHEAHILMGDFNLHHPLWGGSHVSHVSARAKTFVFHTNLAKMECLNDPGVSTYSRGEHNKMMHTSVIDLTFVSKSIKHRAQYRLLKDVRGFTSDHRVSQLVLNLDFCRSTRIRYVWRRVPKETYVERLESKLHLVELQPLRDCSAVSEMLRNIITALEQSVRELVPTVRPSVLDRRQKAEMPDREQRLRNWRKHVTSIATHPLKGIHRLVKMATAWYAPNQLAQTPDLVDQGNVYTKNEDKAECIIRNTWSHYEKRAISTESSNSAAELPLPSLNSERSQHTVAQHLMEGELASILKALPKHKTSGRDGIAYEALRMGRLVIEDHLAHVFNACLSLGIHPEIFKDTITVLILKPGKPPDRPNSYRPIALLSCIGKMLERVVTNRLAKLAEEHDLIPHTQFGSPGRSTTLALENLLNHVYQGWVNDQKVSLLALDLTGAFDHIDRNKLLERLVSKGIPDWLIKWIRSFLSRRRTTLKMPGYDSEEYWINVGIPQGSPLSPILFLFYAAPLIQEHENLKEIARYVLLSYVDDTYIICRSSSWVSNCTTLTAVHQALFDWAGKNNLCFSPKKYRLFHFIKPRSKRKDLPTEQHIPRKIPGFETMTPEEQKNIMPDTLKVLGVMLDRSLSFQAHLAYIRSRVHRELALFRRISGPTWGADLVKMRTLYKSRILAKILYAAGAWFIHVHTKSDSDQTLSFGLTNSFLDSLEKIHRDCMFSITGARLGTKLELLQSEMHIFPIIVRLDAAAMTHRYQYYDSQEHQRMREYRKTQYTNLRNMRKHPYHQLEAVVERHLCYLKATSTPLRSEHDFRVAWSNKKQRKKMIKSYAFNRAYEYSRFYWEQFQLNYAAQRRYLPIAALTSLEFHKLRLYCGLSRAESTMLLAMRTGNIELLGNSIYRHATNAQNRTCTMCHKYIHTAEHLLIHCTGLDRPRTQLISSAGHLSFGRFMTVPEDAKLAAAWAIKHFGCKQFENVKERSTSELTMST